MGTRLRIPDKGNPSLNGGPPGDLYIVININPHAFLERKGNDIIYHLPISFPQASLGTKIEVPTLEGKAMIKIPPGTQSGDVFRLRGKGMPDVRLAGLGDMLVQVNIEVPKQVTEEEEELLRQLAELEHKNVAPARKSFIEQVKDYLSTHDEQS